MEYHERLHHCPHCNSVILFVLICMVWRSLPEEVFSKAAKESGGADIFISAGTSSMVYPASQLPHLALYNYAFLMEFNLEPTDLTKKVNFFARGKTEETFPEFLDFVRHVRSF